MGQPVMILYMWAGCCFFFTCSSVWRVMTTLKQLHFVMTVWSTCVQNVLRPTKESTLPKTTPLNKRQTDHKVFILLFPIIILHVFILYSYILNSKKVVTLCKIPIRDFNDLQISFTFILITLEPNKHIRCLNKQKIIHF